MKKIISMIVGLMLLCACVQKPLVAHQELKLVIASDIHFFLKEYYQECEWFEESMMYGDGKMVTYADEILDAFVAEMKIQKPDLIILTGDLSFNGEKGSHQGLAEHLMKLKDEGIHVAVLPGNHDVDNINAKGYGKDDYMEVAKTNAKDFENIYQDLGYDIAVNKHENSLSYRIDLNDDYSLVMLDTTSHEQTTQTALDIGGLLSEKTYSWLQTELGQIEKENRRPLIAMHHNLVDHNELLNRGYTIRDNQKIIELFEQYHVPFVFRGHIHCQNIKKANTIYDIASSSLLDAPLQYGIVELNATAMNYQTHSLKISKDANQYFDEVSRNRFMESFETVKDQKRRDAMLDVLVKANRYFFAGEMNKHIDEIKNMAGYSYFYDKQMGLDSFYRQYLESMLNEKESSQNLTLKFS